MIVSYKFSQKDRLFQPRRSANLFRFAAFCLCAIALAFFAAGCLAGEPTTPEEEMPPVTTGNQTQPTDTDIPDDEARNGGPDLTDPFQRRPSQPGGTLRLWWPLDSQNHPLLVESRSEKAVFDLVFEGLFAVMDDQSLQPRLADSLSDPADSTQVTVRLARGEVFHHGEPVTAPDVAACIAYILDHPEQSPYAAGLGSITGMTAEDDYTLILELSEPQPWLAYQLTFPVLPAAYLDQRANDLIPGTGLFAMREWTDEQVLLLSKAQPSDDHSELRQISVRPYPDIRAALRGFSSDEIDLVFLDADLYQQYQPRSSLRFRSFSGSRQVFLSYNTASGSFLASESRFLSLKHLVSRQFYQNLQHPLGETAQIPLTIRTGLLEGQIPDPLTVLESFSPPEWEDTAYTLTMIWPEGDAARHLLAAEIGQILEQAGVSWQQQPLAATDFAQAVLSGDYDLALLEAVIPAAPDPGWLYLSEIDSRLDRHDIIPGGPDEQEEDTASQITGMEFADYGYWQDNLRQMWRARSPRQLMSGEDLALLLSHTAARAPWDGLVIRHEAILYSERIIGVSRPDRFRPYEGIEDLWVWSTQ